MSNLAGQIIKGSVLLASARAISNLLGWIGTIVLARMLTPDDYGLVAIAVMIQVIVMAITEMSFGEALIHHRAPEADHFHTAWTLGLARGLLLSGLLSAAAYPASLFFGDARLELVIYASAFGTFLTSMNNPRWILLQKQMNFKYDFILGVASRLLAVVVSIGIAVVYQSFWALVWGGIAGQLAGLIISYMVVPFRPRLRLNRTRELWSFSIWLTLGQAINTINWRFDQLLVGKLLGRTELGYYSVGDNLAQMPTRESITPLRRTLFPAFNQISQDPPRLRNAYQRTQSLISAIALPVGVGFALVAEPLVHAAMGEKWLPAVPIIQALSAVFAFQTFGSIVQPLAMSMGATKSLFWRDMLVFCMRLPIILLGLFLGGLHGLVLARVVTGILGTFMNMDLVRRLSGLSIGRQLQANQRTLLSILIMAVGVMLLRHFVLPASRPDELHLILEVLVIGAVGATLHLGSGWLLWRLQKCPNGPEQEVATMITRLIAHRRAAQAAGIK